MSILHDKLKYILWIWSRRQNVRTNSCCISINICNKIKVIWPMLHEFMLYLRTKLEKCNIQSRQHCVFRQCHKFEIKFKCKRYMHWSFSIFVV